MRGLRVRNSRESRIIFLWAHMPLGTMVPTMEGTRDGTKIKAWQLGTERIC